MKNNKVIFWLLSLAWGLPMTLVGAAAALILYWKAYIPTRIGPCWVFTVGEGWGGINLGPVIIVSKTAKVRTICHEIGHALQNCLWGPLFPFVVAIPSVIRYQLREIKDFKNKTKFTLIFDFALLATSILCLLFSLNVINASLWIELVITLIDMYLIINSLWLSNELKKYIITPYPSYDDIWFEGQATRWGIKYTNNEEE